MIEAWKIGVNIAMTSNAAQVLGVLGRDLFAMGRQAEALTSKLNAVKLAAVGAMGVIAGGAVLTGMAKLVEHGKELVHQQALFQLSLKESGLTAQQVAEETAKVTDAAFRNTRDVLGTSFSENFKNIRELRGVFGKDSQGDVAGTNEAIKNLASVTKAQQVIRSLLGNEHSDQAFEMAKALEIKGVSMDPSHFEKMLDSMVKASVAFGGRVTGTDFFSAFKYGRTATLGWSDDFVGKILPTLMQEMKSGNGSGSGTGGPGNALQSMFQAVVGGVMSNKAATEFNRLGLLDPTKVITTKTGSVKGVQPGGVFGSADFEQNPYEWVQKYLVPALNKSGITDANAVREEVAHLFVNRTAQQIATMFATQQLRIQKDAALVDQAGGLGGYDALLAADPDAKIRAFKTAWDNLLTSLGSTLVTPATDMLLKLARAINYLGDIAQRHSTITYWVLTLTAALAGMAVVGGTLLIVVAGLKAFAAITGLRLAATGLMLVAGGLRALTAIAWVGLATGAKEAAGGLGLLLGVLARFAGPLAFLYGMRPSATQGPGVDYPGGMKGAQPASPGQQLGPQSPNLLLPQGQSGPESHPRSLWMPGGGGDKGSQQHGDVYLDGKKVGQVLWPHLANEISRPSNGSNNPDLRQSPLYPGVNGNWALA